MPTQRLTTNAWSSATLVRDEHWQALGGTILMQDEPPTAPDAVEGLEIVPGGFWRWPAGTTVYFRAVLPAGVEATIRLVRVGA
jgi:hypothetical protein